MRQLAAQDKFSGTVLLVHAGRPVLARSYGMADKQRSVRNGPDTIYALASVTKMFTAVAIAQLLQQGRLALGEKLDTYLDGFPAEVANAVTIHQLLTHTSGMGDYAQSPGYFDEAFTWTTAEQVFDRTLGYVRQAPLAFIPGSAFLYSNSGYHTLGAIVAKVSGQDYYSYVREHVFARAGMTSSDFYTKPQWSTGVRFARPYATQPSGERADASDLEPYIGWPAGNSFATAPDLVRFAQALRGDELLEPAFTELVLGPKVPMPPLPPKPGVTPPIGFQAYVPGAKLVNHQWAVGHNGAAPGISTNLEWFPASGWVVVKLSNYDVPTTAAIDEMARTLITQHYRGQST